MDLHGCGITGIDCYIPVHRQGILYHAVKPGDKPEKTDKEKDDIGEQFSENPIVFHIAPVAQMTVKKSAQETAYGRRHENVIVNVQKSYVAGIQFKPGLRCIQAMDSK